MVRAVAYGKFHLWHSLRNFSPFHNRKFCYFIAYRLSESAIDKLINFRQGKHRRANERYFYPQDKRKFHRAEKVRGKTHYQYMRYKGHGKHYKEQFIVEKPLKRACAADFATVYRVEKLEEHEQRDGDSGLFRRRHAEKIIKLLQGHDKAHKKGMHGYTQKHFLA